MEYILALEAGLSGDSKSELMHFRKAVDGIKPTFDSWSGYVNALIKSNEYFEGIEASEKALSLFPEEKDFILKLAKNLSMSGDSDKAMKTVSLFLDISPGNEDGLSLAGKIAMEKRSYSDALRYFSSGIELYPGNPENYINRGDVYRSTSTWEFAISDYSMALDLDPVNADVYYNKALVLLRTGNRDDACRNLRMALKYGNKKASIAINRNCIR